MKLGMNDTRARDYRFTGQILNISGGYRTMLLMLVLDCCPDVVCKMAVLVSVRFASHLMHF